MFQVSKNVERPLCEESPQTLLKRCHSFLRFVQYLKDAGECFPGVESGLCACLCDLQASGAPTSNMQSSCNHLTFSVLNGYKCVDPVVKLKCDHLWKYIWIYPVCCDCVWTGMHAAFDSGIYKQITG